MELGNGCRWIATANGQVAADRDGANVVYTSYQGKFWREFFAHEELHAPSRLSIEDAERELGFR
jgi:hypothetical protein